MHETAELCEFFSANSFLNSLITPSKSAKLERMALTKLELMRITKEARVTSVSEEYDATKQTVEHWKIERKKLSLLLTTVISFYLHYINIFVLSRTFSLSREAPAPLSPEK